MKSFRQYLTESVHTYNYTIKLLGEVDEKVMELFRYNLNKFNPIEISPTTTTPIQKTPYGFDGAENQRVSTIRCKFKYPATEAMIRDIARLLRVDENRVRMINSEHDDSQTQERDAYENQSNQSPLLMTADTFLGSDDKKAKEKASKDYANQYLDNIKDSREESKITQQFAANIPKSTHDAFQPIEAPGKLSPMSKISLPPRPSIGTK